MQKALDGLSAQETRNRLPWPPGQASILFLHVILSGVSDANLDVGPRPSTLCWMIAECFSSSPLRASEPWLWLVVRQARGRV